MLEFTIVSGILSKIILPCICLELSLCETFAILQLVDWRRDVNAFLYSFEMLV